MTGIEKLIEKRLIIMNDVLIVIITLLISAAIFIPLGIALRTHSSKYLFSSELSA